MDVELFFYFVVAVGAIAGLILELRAHRKLDETEARVESVRQTQESHGERIASLEGARWEGYRVPGQSQTEEKATGSRCDQCGRFVKR